MKLEQSFEVAAPLQRVWEALIDVERVAPCLPGASVTGRNDDGTYNGEFKVKIGPTSASYSGKLKMENIDVDTHTATMDAAGTDKRGQGGAKATIISSVADAGGGNTTVSVDTDYHITGRLARFGRGGMIEEISNRLLGEFSKNLQTMLAAGSEIETESVSESGAEPAEDPDAAIEGATPVAAALADEPTSVEPEPAPEPEPEPVLESEPEPESEPAPEPDAKPAHTPPPPPPPPPANEPLDAGSLVGSAVLSQVKSNPAPLIALVVGFLVALRVFRRRG